MPGDDQQPSSSVLALDAAPADSAPSWRARGAALVDALPYVDSLTPSERALADRLIEAELASSTKTPEDYLRELPPARDLDPAKLSPLIRAELVRVSEGKAFPPLDASRYRLDPPPQNRRGDAVAWRACLDNARAQLEHQANRCVNLELALRFGARAAEAGAAHSAASAALLRSEARAALARVEAVNRRRKLEQEKAAEEAGEHEGRWVRGVRKCAEIEAACARLEEEVAALAAEAGGQQQGAKKKREEEGGEREGEKGHGKKSNNSDNNFGLPALPGGGEGEEEEEARR